MLDFGPYEVSRLFDDVSTSMKLQNAVSAVVDCRKMSTSPSGKFAEVQYQKATAFARRSLTVISCLSRVTLPVRVQYIHAAAGCATSHPSDASEAVYIPLTAGSVPELYIQSMLSCIGDIDVMCYRSDQLAITEGYPPRSQLPAEFDSRVKAYEVVDSHCPGYVYLRWSYVLTENTDTDKYDAWHVAGWRQYLSYEYSGMDFVRGPAELAYDKKTGLAIDRIMCIRYLSWPTQATDWPTRHRHYGWPDSATVDHVVSNGCDVVRLAHRW